LAFSLKENESFFVSGFELYNVMFMVGIAFATHFLGIFTVCKFAFVT